MKIIREMRHINLIKTVLIAILLATVYGCSAKGKAFLPMEQEPDRALIYIYRPNMFPGSANVWHLRDDEKKLAMVKNGGWFAYYKKAGPVTLYTNLRPGVGTLLGGAIDSDRVMMKLNVEAGKTYYIKFSLHYLGPTMSLVDNIVGSDEIKNLKMFDEINK